VRPSAIALTVGAALLGFALFRPDDAATAPVPRPLPAPAPPSSGAPPGASPGEGPHLRVSPVGQRVTGVDPRSVYEVVSAPTRNPADVTLRVIAYPRNPQSEGATFKVAATIDRWGMGHPVVKQLQRIL